MAQSPLCLPIDTVRRFDPQQTRDDLENNDFLGDPEFGDSERFRARIEGIEDQFVTDTDTALRPTRVGSVGAPATYEHHDNKYWKHTPSTVYLDHRNIHPIDATQGDAIELRVGINQWRDITADEGERWVADYKMGKLELYSRVRGHRGYRNIRDQRFVRLTYRHGALGGDRRYGGQTTLSASLDNRTDPPTTVDVENAARLPSSGGTMLVGGFGGEYVRVGTVDPQANTIEIAAREQRGTTSTTHDAGAIVHYCPLNVREGIAAATARELVLFSDWADRMVDENENTLSQQAKLDEWKSEFESVVARYTEGKYH